MTRNYTIRKMTITQQILDTMGYPYDFIKSGEYPLEEILQDICIEKEIPDPGNFPDNIQEHYWIHSGENDGDDWMAVGKLTNGSYFLYTGGCDYTGFDCQGGMRLWVNPAWERIIDYAMSNSIYKSYMDETQEST